MKKKSLFLFYFALWGLASPVHALNILIDPGHGGVDQGAVRGKIKEADLVLEVSKMVRDLISQNPQFSVSLTRENDHSLTLKKRVEIVHQRKPDLFISLHANAAEDSRAKGLEFFIQNNLPPSEESYYQAALENQIFTNESDTALEIDPSKKGDLIAIVEDLKRQHRVETSLKASKIFQKNLMQKQQATIKQAPFYVISKAQVPSVLVELGFISNPTESQLLTNVEYQKHLSQKIYDSLVEYKEKVDKSSREQLQ